MTINTLLLGLCIIALIIAIGSWALADDWQKKAATAFFIVGQRGRTKEEREWGYRNALLAGNQKAEKYYFYSAIEKFMNEKPLIPFPLEINAKKSIPCVFFNYYIPKSEHGFISWEQRNFIQSVFNFKDGKDNCFPLFKQALSKLDLPDETTILLFMPCSSERSYISRYTSLCQAFSNERGLKPYLFSITYLKDRNSKHHSTQRNEIKTESNVAIRADIVGQKVILIDDVITTGNSIREYTEELARYGIQVLGAVCLARTARYPFSDTTALYQQAKKDNTE